MKNYYYTLSSDIPKGKGWDKAIQREGEFKDWAEFAAFCKNLSRGFNCEVRGCESQGYNNNGSYFYAL